MATYLRDIPNAALINESIAIRTVTTTTTAAAASDMLLGDGRCTLIAPIVATSLTGITVKVQQSTLTNSGFADVTGASVSATTSGINSVSFDRDMRYLQTVVVLNGTTAQVEAMLIEQKKVLP